MLLEVALDLDAEAEAMEAGGPAERRGFPRVHRPEIREALLHMVDPLIDTCPVQIVNLSAGGAKLRTDRTPTVGSNVTLELPGRGLRLDGTILRTRGLDAAMAFDPASSADPALGQLLRSGAMTDQILVAGYASVPLV
jgi:hypothetical protein